MFTVVIGAFLWPFYGCFRRILFLNFSNAPLKLEVELRRNCGFRVHITDKIFHTETNLATFSKQL